MNPGEEGIGGKHYGPFLVSLGLAALAAVAVFILLAGPVSHVLSQRADRSSYNVERMVLLYATLPRLVMALLCGAGLAAAGAILQQVLLNPLASPTTLGVDAGARLALALATIFTPSLLGIGRDAVALIGSAASTLLVFALVRRAFSPISIVLAGLVVSLYCGALSAMLILVKDRYLGSLFIWGSGSLSQQSWQPSAALALLLAIVAMPLVFLLRPLALLDLGDETARSLGLSVDQLRLLAIAIAVALSAFVTSAVGIIGFIGLVAPIIARLSGARRFGERLLWSSVIGALLLLLTDAALQNLTGVSSEFLPTGAVTALLASPLVLILLPRLKVATRPPSQMSASHGFAIPRHIALAIALIAFVLLVACAIFVGRSPSGAWQIMPTNRWDDIFAWRLPRMAAAASAGALLGTAGLILQRLTNNEMASPEVLGVSAGAIFAVSVTLFTFGSLGTMKASVAATVGGLAVLGIILVLGRPSGFAPERVLLAGIALSALMDAVIGLLSATGDPRAVVLLGWMSGSTNGATTTEALGAGIAALALVASSLLLLRWLAILPLGGPQAMALGVPLARSRFLLLLLAAVMTAAATPIIGPLTFVGLMAPHIVLVIGIRRILPALLSTAAAGASVMVAADWLARTVAFPLQLPTGLVAAMVGAPFLMVLLSRRGASHVA
jgi:ABC-type Fe3+-siderophore transport system permease subunit